MNRLVHSIVLACLFTLACTRTSAEAQEKPTLSDSLKAEKQTRYLAFQIFTYGPNPIIATMGEGTHPQPARFPEKAVLRDYIEDIKRRIGAVGDQQTRLAVMLGHLSFDHGDAQTVKFIELGFELALETDVAVGFHIDDSMFWATRKDLGSDPNNVEALDWDGTPCTGRLLNWGKEPSAPPPQMCFNSKVIQREVRQCAALLGKAIQAGVNRLQQLNRPELFAGAIAGSETQIGQDFKTGKYLGYRALLNRGFSREHPPQDMDLEREKIVQEFIDLWTTGLADAGVSPQKIYSHICFLSRRAFGGDDKEITYMKRKGEDTYSQHNHFTPPSVAFGKDHRPGFSTYPQGGLFEDIYEEVARHNQVGWASCEGTNMQPSSGPGQTGMNMETYLAKMFNHGATLTTIFSWGIGGEAMKEKIGFRVATEGEEALQAYRKVLKGVPLVEGATVASLTDRLPPKIHQIQKELPAWMQKTGNTEKVAADKAAGLLQKMQEQLKAKNFVEVERIADSILKMMGASTPAGAQGGDNKPEQTPPSSSPSDDPTKRLTEKVERVQAQEKVAGKHPSGEPSIITRDYIQDELKLSDDQKHKLQKTSPDFRKVLDSQEKTWAFLEEALSAEQFKRFEQLELQHEGPPALFRPEITKELQITDEQRKQFMGLVQEMTKKLEPLMKEAKSAANPQEMEKMRQEVITMRRDCQGKMEALMSDAQKKRWKEMIGKPFDTLRHH